MASLRSVDPRLALPAFALLALSCANQIPPSGGPQDVTGPKVVYVSPRPYSLNVSTDVIEIEFDEFVDRRSAVESIFISPTIEDLEFDWWGKSVEISFPGPLRENTTYVVTIGTDVTDLESSRRNRMEQAFSFPFSTGASIDRGLIGGEVLPLKQGDEMGGVMVYAYLLPTGRADTLDVRRANPTYVTQAGKNGSFGFPHIRLGTYFVMALRDAARNIVYNVGEDEYAVAPSTILISRLDTAYTSLVLQLAQEDTIAPRLTDVKAPDRNHIEVGFSEPFDTLRQRRPVATVTDTLTAVRKNTYSMTPVLPDRKRARITTDFLDPESVYRITLSGVFDDRGNEARPRDMTMVFRPEAKTDTLPPMIRSVSLRDSATGFPVRGEVRITLSEPVGLEAWTSGRVQLRLLPEGTLQAVNGEWVTENILGIRPAEELRSFSWYALSVLWDGLTDWKLEPLKDSLSLIRFRTEDVYDTGSIEGRVTDIAPRDTAGRAIVIARRVGEKENAEEMTECGRDGTFVLARLKPGQYVLHSFKDRNANRRYDTGAPVPYVPSERRSAWTDTLKVRSRWPLEGVLIRIP